MDVFRTRISHLEKLSSSLENLRETDCNCDFAIKVGEESFPVHRNVLIAASDYFRAMLSHDTKERQDGVVDMMEIEPDAVKFCIEFMYIGTTTVTMETVENLLPAAEIMQLNALSKICVEVLKKNLKSENCISVLKLARTYNCTDLEEEALKLFRVNFKFEEFGDFAELGKEDLVQRISDCALKNELVWEVIINWIKHNVEERSKYVPELVKLLNWKKIPSGNLLENIWSEPIITELDICKRFIFRNIFLDLCKLESGLDLKNYFVVRRMSEEYQDITKQAKKIVNDFMKVNAMSLSQNKEFLLLTYEEISRILDDHVTSSLCSEETFWNFIVKWTKYDSTRNSLFPELMNKIRFDRLPKQFIDTTVKNECLLEENPNCFKVFMDAVTSQILETKDGSYIAVLYPDGKIFAMDFEDKSWISLPDVDISDSDFVQMFSFNDKLCIIVDDSLKYLDCKELKWINRARLTYYPDEKAKVVTTCHNIYIVEQEGLFCYDSITDTWDESLPGCDIGEIICVTASMRSLKVYNAEKQVQYFDLPSQTWSDIKSTKTEISTFASAVYNKGTNYLVGKRNAETQWNYNGASRLGTNGRQWMKICDIPQLITSQSRAFSTGDDVIVFLSDVFYVYHEMSNTWGKITELPKYRKFRNEGFGVVQELSPISVCAFKGNLGELAKFQIN